jgi:hypothetical protein
MDENRFDWGAIARATGIVVGITTAYALIIPIVGAFIDGNGPLTTSTISGHEIYRWLYWGLAWGLIIWQASWMIRNVGDRIIDDMLVTSVFVAITLLIVKVITSIIYAPVDSDGQNLFLIGGIDAAGALMVFVVALIGARINRY